MSGYQLLEIRAEDKHAYVVVLGANEERLEFNMRVEGEDIPVVSWDRDFVNFMANDTGRAELLFAAILKFHRARSIRLP